MDSIQAKQVTGEWDSIACAQEHTANSWVTFAQNTYSQECVQECNVLTSTRADAQPLHVGEHHARILYMCRIIWVQTRLTHALCGISHFIIDYFYWLLIGISFGSLMLQWLIVFCIITSILNHGSTSNSCDMRLFPTNFYVNKLSKSCLNFLIFQAVIAELSREVLCTVSCATKFARELLHNQKLCSDVFPVGFLSESFILVI